MADTTRDLHFENTDEGQCLAYLSLLKTIDLLHLGLKGNKNVTDECLFKIVNRCGKYRGVDLSVSACNKERDAGVLSLGHRCV